MTDPTRMKTRAMAAAAGLAAWSAAAAAQPLESLPPSAAYGPHAVGAATGFAVDNRQRFDPWGTAYGPPGYREVLRRVEASGQPRTVAFHLWYPAEPSVGGGRVAGPRSPRPAASGRRADFFDFYFRDDALARRIAAAAQVVQPPVIHLRGGGTLAEAAGDARDKAFAEIGRRILGAPRGSWIGARPADGKFPLILLAHGLAGSYGMWSSLGEFLASHGYVVVAPTFVSDGGLPLVFHDPDSAFARGAAPQEVARAYDAILGQVKVVPYFYRLLFGVEGRGFAPPEGFDPPRMKIVPGGVERLTTMMRNLFRQRVSDAGLLLHAARLLGADAETCAASLRSMGSASAARDLCGLLAGRVDGERTGVAGHSLGSMTAQMAASHLPGVRAALGLNNAPPFAWTPEEVFGAGEARDGLPAGARKPVLLLIGDEDAFVQRVFASLLQSAVSAAGGDPGRAFPLAPERAAPDRSENPQPVALSAWRRALSDRGLVIVRDTDHFTLAEDFARLFPWPAFRRGEIPFAQTPDRVRKPVGARAFAPPSGGGEPYTQLGWAAVGGEQAYLPHVIRDWYARAWFDWHLKGDEDARRRLLAPDPFGTLTASRIELR